MNRVKYFIVCLLLLASDAVFAHGDDDPWLNKLVLDEFEVREDNVSVVNGEWWSGMDLHKLWLKADWESQDGDTETAELQALYSRAAAPFWDLQIGMRHDFGIDNQPDQTWAAFGIKGLAPYFFDIDAAVFVGDRGDTALRLEAEYELLLSQRWVLIPNLEINAYGQNDEERLRGAGLSDGEVGLRLAYHLRREVAPYLGVSWSQYFGNSADMRTLAGDANRESTWVAGLKLWF